MILASSSALSLFFNKIPTLAQVWEIHYNPFWTAAFVGRVPIDNRNVTDDSQIVNGRISKIISSTRAGFAFVVILIIIITYFFFQISINFVIVFADSSRLKLCLCWFMK